MQMPFSDGKEMEHQKIRPVILAPMAGVTDSAYRQTALFYGADFCCTEMISAKALRFESERTLLIAEIPAEEKPAVIQLFGRDPGDFTYAVSFLQERQPDKILGFDINMGCPAPKIVKNGEGSALMLETELAAEIVEQAKNVSQFPVTAKIRKGYSREQENYLEFAKALEGAGLDGITLHGRFREEYYSGRADWEAVKKLKTALSIPVYANGDIKNHADALAVLETTNADGLMAGRAASATPLCFPRSKGLSSLPYSAPAPEERGGRFLQARMASSYKGVEDRQCRRCENTRPGTSRGFRAQLPCGNEATSISTFQELQSFVARAFGYTQ